MDKVRTIFIGTPTFALPSLEALANDPYFDVIGVITQPDRPVGRNQVLTQPPVKELARKMGLPVMQPEKIRDFVAEIESLKPDLIVLVAYGQIIPKAILDIPRFGCINVHGSLLPKYRGAAVIQAPILNGDAETGVTVMMMDVGLDTGPILAQEKIRLEPNETAATLFPKIAHLGAQLLPKTMKRYIAGGIKPQPQDDSLASYVKALNKEDASIDWSKTATEIERLVRAMSPWPGAWTRWNSKVLKIAEVELAPLKINQYRPGQTFVNNGRLAVQCGINSLVISRLQMEGKTEMSSEDFLRGQSEIIHQILTSS
jgi:methionyl-tRNA formyltransferase